MKIRTIASSLALFALPLLGASRPASRPATPVLHTEGPIRLTSSCEEFPDALRIAAKAGNVDSLERISEALLPPADNVDLWVHAFECAYLEGHVEAVKFILGLPGCFDAVREDFLEYMEGSLLRHNYDMMRVLSMALHSHLIEDNGRMIHHRSLD